MKKSMVLVSLILVALFVSCASSPRWYNNVPKSRYKFYGTGSSDLQSKEKSRKFAVMRARDSIAGQVEARMQEAATDYYQQNDVTSNPQAIAFVEEIARQVINVQLKYTHIEEIEIGKDGITYALVSLRTADLRKALREKNRALKLQAKLAKKSDKKPAIPPKLAQDSQNIIQFYIDSSEE